MSMLMSISISLYLHVICICLYTPISLLYLSSYPSSILIQSLPASICMDLYIYLMSCIYQWPYNFCLIIKQICLDVNSKFPFFSVSHWKVSNMLWKEEKLELTVVVVKWFHTDKHFKGQAQSAQAKVEVFYSLPCAGDLVRTHWGWFQDENQREPFCALSGKSSWFSAVLTFNRTGEEEISSCSTEDNDDDGLSTSGPWRRGISLSELKQTPKIQKPKQTSIEPTTIL